MTSSDKHTGWVFNRHSECVQRTSEQADKLQLGTLHCQISMKWKQWCQASKQPGCISKKLCFCREPWFWAGLLGFGTTVTVVTLLPAFRQAQWSLCCTSLHSTDNPSTTYSFPICMNFWCWLSAWMIQGWMLSTLLESVYCWCITFLTGRHTSFS